jgi:hypothetical protein
MFLFHVACEIGGRTVEELRDALLAEELTSWAAFFEMRAEAEKESIERAKAQAKRGGR